MKSYRLTGFGLAGLLASLVPIAGTCVAREQEAAKKTPAPLIEVAKRPVYGPGMGDGDYQVPPPYANAPELTLWYGERQSDVPLSNHGVLHSITFDPKQAVASGAQFGPTNHLFSGDYMDFGYPSIAVLGDGDYLLQFHSEQFPAGPDNMFTVTGHITRDCN